MAEVSASPWARNTTGLPSASRYRLGRGVLKYAELTGADVPDGNGWIHLGNIPTLTATLTRNFLDHFSSMSGLRDRDARIAIESLFDMRAQLEEPTEDAAVLFWQSTPAGYTNPAIAGFTEYSMIAAVKKGRSYPIINGSGVQARGIDSSDLTVEKSGSPDTALVEGTDYTVDEKSGEIHFLSTGSTLSDGDTVDVTLAANASAETTRSIPVQNRSEVTVALKLIAEDGRSQEKWELYIPKATISPDGDLGLITGQDLMTIPISISALKKDSTTPIATVYPLPPGGVT
jgi:hypothetical protein